MNCKELRAAIRKVEGNIAFRLLIDETTGSFVEVPLVKSHLLDGLAATFQPKEETRLFLWTRPADGKVFLCKERERSALEAPAAADSEDEDLIG